MRHATAVPRQTSRRLDGRELGLTLVAAIVLGILWYSPLMFPLRYFSVLVHECSHALACLVTGGTVDSITLNSETGGVTFVHGGNTVIVSSAGYLGSVLFGSLCLYLSRFRSSAWCWCLSIGILLTGMTMTFVSFFHDPFGYCYGTVAGIVVGVVGWKLNRLAPYFLRFLGVSVSLFSFMDIQSTLFNGSAARAHSDAGILGAATGIPSIFWAVAWLAFAIAMFLPFAYLSATKQPQLQKKTVRTSSRS